MTMPRPSPHIRHPTAALLALHWIKPLDPNTEVIRF